MFAGYFEILEIKPTKDVEVVKLAYKKVANKYHPDKNPQDQEWAEEKFKLVSEAYRQLLDTLSGISIDSEILDSCFYNPSQHRAYESSVPNYWDTIKTSADPADKIKLILRELELEKKDSALALFTKLEDEMTGVSPLSLLTPKDYFDACYLLGESFESVQNFEKCVDYYAIYLKHIRIQLHRRSFSEELKRKIVKIYKTKLCKVGRPPKRSVEMIVNAYEKLLNTVVLQNKEKAIIYRDMAGLFSGTYSEKTGFYLKKALEFNPKIGGLDRFAFLFDQFDQK